MTISEWIKASVKQTREDGIRRGVSEAMYQFYVGGWRRLGRFSSTGESIFERDWDLLIVLDACRCDLIEEIDDEYDFLCENEGFVSLGSGSEEWMNKNFCDDFHEEVSRTTYVSGNVFTRRYAEPNEFAMLDEVWKYGWDDEHGTVLAETITDRAIEINRSREVDRLIVHYMQPHTPSVPDPLGEGMTGNPDTTLASPESSLDRLRSGELARKRVWKSYKENLRYVLNSVAVLLNNIDAKKVVISADHGELMGEWGLYGHPWPVPIPSLRRVPWYVSSASDNETYEPTIEPDDEMGNVTEKLESLGYK
ncbi:hypothetical protein NKF26_11065 [Haladaptatus sp. AB618]|uniref:hypothetical protein n=1 Tax=Haladaptatus sp. AB618 TaxID=2934173 RepID=UPI00209C42CC|nr:hypothetical protein [Haladaptatus sp. AB618]MCO8254343.1 hypothetical protein [Haladaptatus sp. AB618]